ncbi:MAG: hypothetical protein PHU23_15810 [Dehalococcoidales bacterium]|nr:hypothetical protein [Dehalococcoidales bacterium]
MVEDHKLSAVERFCLLVQEEEPLEKATILAYEAGNVLEQAKYLSWAEEGCLPESDILVIRGKLKSNLMDVMLQAWALCQQVGEDPKEWIELGGEKAIEALSKRRAGNLHSHVEGKW